MACKRWDEFLGVLFTCTLVALSLQVEGVTLNL